MHVAQAALCLTRERMTAAIAFHTAYPSAICACCFLSANRLYFASSTRILRSLAVRCMRSVSPSRNK